MENATSARRGAASGTVLRTWDATDVQRARRGGPLLVERGAAEAPPESREDYRIRLNLCAKAPATYQTYIRNQASSPGNLLLRSVIVGLLLCAVAVALLRLARLVRILLRRERPNDVCLRKGELASFREHVAHADELGMIV